MTVSDHSPSSLFQNVVFDKEDKHVETDLFIIISLLPPSAFATHSENSSVCSGRTATSSRFAQQNIEGFSPELNSLWLTGENIK